MRIFHNKSAVIREFIKPSDTVLDVGFWGQGVNPDSPHWVHALLREQATDVWGIDLEYDVSRLPGPPDHYLKMSAENFEFDHKFDVVFAGDLIEHLSNPGLFLTRSYQSVKADGRLIISTPNAFNLFNLTEKLSKAEPTVNPDHTCYFNSKTLSQLLVKNGWTVEEISYVYSLGVLHEESWKKKILNIFYWIASRFTSKFVETLVIVAVPAPHSL